MKRCAKCGATMPADEYDFDYCGRCRPQMPFIRVAFPISSDREIEAFYTVSGDELVMMTAEGTKIRKLNGENAGRVVLNELIARQFDRG